MAGQMPVAVVSGGERQVDSQNHRPCPMALTTVSSTAKLLLQKPRVSRLFPLSQSVEAGRHRKEKLVVRSTMATVELCNAASGSAAEIFPGSACTGKKEPLVAFAVSPGPIRPEGTFAVVFSVSRAICDGLTYYKLLAMLSSDGKIEPLSACARRNPAGRSAAQLCVTLFVL